MIITYLTNQSDVVDGSAGDDRLYGWSDRNAPGDEGPGGDRDRLFGRAGNDHLAGGAGSLVFGGAGKETIYARGGP